MNCVLCGAPAHAVAHTVVLSSPRERGVEKQSFYYADPVCFDNELCVRMTKKFKGLQYVEADGVVIHGKRP